MSKERLTDQEYELIEEGKAARKRSAVRTGIRIAGLSILAGAILVLATKKVFDEIFVEDDWSDVDWGEDDEDYGVY